MTALSSPASSKAPKSLVYPVLRATMPSRTSMNRPAATCAIPAAVSMRLAPRQARTAPAILMALGMVGISVLGLNLGILSRDLIGIISKSTIIR